MDGRGESPNSRSRGCRCELQPRQVGKDGIARDLLAGGSILSPADGRVLTDDVIRRVAVWSLGEPANRLQ